MKKLLTKLKQRTSVAGIASLAGIAVAAYANPATLGNPTTIATILTSVGLIAAADDKKKEQNPSND